MNHRELKDSEVIQYGDQIEIGCDIWLNCENTIGFLPNTHCKYRRPIPEPATFEEASNFDPPIHVTHEEVIYPKADVFGDKEKAIAACLELFKGMDRIIPPTPNQLGVLYDNGLLNITK